MWVHLAIVIGISGTCACWWVRREETTGVGCWAGRTPKGGMWVSCLWRRIARRGTESTTTCWTHLLKSADASAQVGRNPSFESRISDVQSTEVSAHLEHAKTQNQSKNGLHVWKMTHPLPPFEFRKKNCVILTRNTLGSKRVRLTDSVNLPQWHILKIHF